MITTAWPPGRYGLGRTALASLAVLATGLATAVPGWAQPAGQSEPQGQPAQNAAAAPSDAHPVTLLTGDVLSISRLPNGHQAFTVVRAAPRAAGQPVSFDATEQDGSLYIVPSDVEAYLAAGTLDMELFNVNALTTASGSSGTIPVIVSYPTGRTDAQITTASRALPGGTATRLLTSIDSVAMKVAPAQAGRFWESIDADTTPGTTSGRLDARRGIAKVWLDRPAHVDLAESVPQIGAPEAWAAGFDGTGIKVAVLDTGVDTTHPDLAGKVIEARNFTPASTVDDRFGHGTHVASTIAGSGTASGGKYRGVAPGATLLSGKVLDDGGFGSTSGIIAGMEWASQAGADVINMSLSSNEPSDATDPMSLAVDRITAESGVLVVAAAGNKFGVHTVYAPGAAKEALTVGAVDKSDRMANFSSRGPALTTAAVKPEVTAPGVDIVAARAAGTSMPGAVHVGENYTTVSGTSMATPHVVGAAAILAQANPDWQARELKEALVSTARDGGFRVVDQGAGRIDIPRALNQHVYATSSLNFGVISAPDDDQDATQQVTYRNTGSAEVTLTLAVQAQGFAGQPAPDGTVRLSTDTVTVAPGGSATVDVIVNTKAATMGVFTGVVVASTEKGAPAPAQVRTPLSWYHTPRLATLTVRVNNARGQAYSGGLLRVTRANDSDVNDPFSQPTTLVAINDGVATVRVTEGTYQVYDGVFDTTLTQRRFTTLLDADVKVPEETEVRLDARDGIKINPDIDENVMQWGTITGMTRSRVPSGATENEISGTSPGPIDMYFTPAGDVRTGTFSQFDRWTLESSLIDVSVARHQSIRLNPKYDPFAAAPKLAQLNGTVPLAYVGQGTASDLAGKDLRGRVALVRLSVPAVGDDFDQVVESHRLAAEATTNVAAAGARAVFLYVDRPGAVPLLNLVGDPIAQLALSNSEGEALRRVAERDRFPRLHLDGRATPERAYYVNYEHPGGLKDGYRQRVDRSELTRVQARYHADRPGLFYNQDFHLFTPRHQTSGSWSRVVRAPQEWTEYYGEQGEDVTWLRRLNQSTDPLLVGPTQTIGMSVWPVGQRPFKENWYEGAVTTGQPELPSKAVVWREFCGDCRQGDLFVPAEYEVDGSKHYSFLFGGRPGGTVRMFQGDTELPVDRSRGYPRFALSAEPGVYRLDTESQQRATPDIRTLGTKVSNSWTFHSERPQTQMPGQYACRVSFASKDCAFQPLIQVEYDLGLDLLNQARAGRLFTFDVSAGSHSATPDRSRVTSMKVWTSTDDGAAWTPALVLSYGNGHFRVVTLHPRLERTNGFVSLKVQASDRDGNSVTQTVTRAYALSNTWAG